MGLIYDHFLKIIASYLLRFHRIACLWESKGEGSKNFLPEPDSSKTFWQLGCQVAKLFPPLGLTVQGGLKFFGWGSGFDVGTAPSWGIVPPILPHVGQSWNVCSYINTVNILVQTPQSSQFTQKISKYSLRIREPYKVYQYSVYFSLWQISSIFSSINPLYGMNSRHFLPNVTWFVETA